MGGSPARIHEPITEGSDLNFESNPFVSGFLHVIPSLNFGRGVSDDIRLTRSHSCERITG
jgi:hypothetical protein